MSYSETLREEGKQQGREEIMKEVAQELIKSGIDESIIINATHLSPEVIKELKKHFLNYQSAG